MIWAWIETSSAETGSSQTISRGLQDHRPGDADPLALAARELVRVAVDHLRQEAGPGHHVLDPRPDLGAAEARLVGDQRLGDDVADGHARVERGERVLEDDLHRAPVPPQRLAAEPREIVAEPDHAARGRLDQAQDRAAERRLAAAGLADHAERLARRRARSSRRRPP